MAVDPDRVQGWFRVDDPMVEGWQVSLHRQDLVAAGAYALVPRSSLGPALNDQGYYVGQVERNLHWVTDGVYQSAFLTTRDGVVLFDAPPGIGHNLQRAVDEIAAAIGVSKTVTHLVRYGENVWAGVKAHLDSHRPRRRTRHRQVHRRPGRPPTWMRSPGPPRSRSCNQCASTSGPAHLSTPDRTHRGW